MATVLDTLLIDQFTGGVNMPRAADDGKLARVYVDAAGNVNLEYVNIDTNSNSANVLDYGAKGDGTTDDSAAINNALASGKSEVYFPEDRNYLISSAVTGSTADQRVVFAPGAVLKPAAGIGITFSGARMRIGLFEITVGAASSSTYNVLKVSGAGAVLEGGRFNVNDDVPNVSLLRLAADDQRLLAPLQLVGLGKAFK